MPRGKDISFAEMFGLGIFRCIFCNKLAGKVLQ